MAAVSGYIIQELARFPGAIDLDGTTFSSIPNGVGAIGAIPSLGWLQIVASIGYWELIGKYYIKYLCLSNFITLLLLLYIMECNDFVHNSGVTNNPLINHNQSTNQAIKQLINQTTNQSTN